MPTKFKFGDIVRFASSHKYGVDFELRETIGVYLGTYGEWKIMMLQHKHEAWVYWKTKNGRKTRQPHAWLEKVPMDEYESLIKA